MVTVRRIETISDLEALSPGLAQLQNEAHRDLPNFRPVQAEEFVNKAKADRRWPARLLFVAEREPPSGAPEPAQSGPVGFVSVEPTWQARPGGDIYPYVGGEIVLQPSAVPAAGGDDEVQGMLLRRAMRELASRGQQRMHVVVPTQADRLEALFVREGFREHRRLLSLRAEVGAQPLSEAAATTRAMREQDLPAVLALHNRCFTGLHKAYGWEDVRPEDVALLQRTARTYDPRGFVVAESEQDIVGYAVVTVDEALNAEHGLSRGFFALGPLGLAASSGSPPAVSRALMLAGLTSLAALGCREAELVTEARSGVALRFFRDLGFEPATEWLVLAARL